MAERAREVGPGKADHSRAPIFLGLLGGRGRAWAMALAPSYSLLVFSMFLLDMPRNHEDGRAGRMETAEVFMNL